MDEFHRLDVNVTRSDRRAVVQGQELVYATNLTHKFDEGRGNPSSDLPRTHSQAGQEPADHNRVTKPVIEAHQHAFSIQRGAVIKKLLVARPATAVDSVFAP